MMEDSSIHTGPIVNCHDVDLGRYRSSRRRRDALAKIGFHLADGGNELFVLKVPQSLVPRSCGHERQIRDQLAETHVGSQFTQPGQSGKNFLPRWFDHGSKSPTVGSDPNAALIFPITSTRRSVPGASFAIRVARVTPLKITSSPSVLS